MLIKILYVYVYIFCIFIKKKYSLLLLWDDHCQNSDEHFHQFYFFFLKDVIYLFEMQCQREREIFHPPVHSLMK